VAHPDALSVPVGKEDRAALEASIDCVGVLEPLTVVREGDNDYLVIDGVGRLQSAKETDEPNVPCMLVECEDVRTYVAHKNAMGRKRSTGSRTLSYVMANYDKMRKALDNGANVKTHWSQSSVADRLKVSREDVGLAVALYDSVSLGKDEYGADLSEADAAKLRQVFNAVLSAALPIRRWRAAFAGALTGTQPGQSGRAQADYAAVLTRGIDEISSAFKRWPDIQWRDEGARVCAHKQFGAALSHMPESLRVVVAQSVLDRWTKAEQTALLKRLRAQLGS
jgi:hypothetical protein